VSNKRLAQRIVAVLGTTAVFLLFVALVQGGAGATPIQPDVRQLVEQQQEPPPKFEPARAGWNGPETASGSSLPLELTRAAQTRAVRRALAIVVTPDPRALAMILLLIVLLRKLREKRETPALAPAERRPEWQMPRAA
jgi:hypothetical protein